MHSVEDRVSKNMRDLTEKNAVRATLIISFAWRLIYHGFRLIRLTIFETKSKSVSSYFAEIFSQLWDTAEHSISHADFDLPSALGARPVHNVSSCLKKLYGGKYASLSFGGSSGALLTILTAVLPKLKRDRKIILFDDMCHQSAIGGLIFGRWEAIRLSRIFDPDHQTAQPLKFETVRETMEAHGADRIAALILVLPTYDGFRSPSEDKKIYAYAKSKGILVIVDGAWDSVRFRESQESAPPLETICDVWVSSPHKRGLTPSSLGCMITNDKIIAHYWDQALDLGFRSSSVSFVEIMIAEHRLTQVIVGDWDTVFSKTEAFAESLRKQISDIHPNLYVVEPVHIQAEVKNPAHILIHTGKIPNFNAQKWAKTLAAEFALDVEKATDSTLLLLCGSPEHSRQRGRIMETLKASFEMTLERSCKSS